MKNDVDHRATADSKGDGSAICRSFGLSQLVVLLPVMFSDARPLAEKASTLVHSPKRALLWAPEDNRTSQMARPEPSDKLIGKNVWKACCTPIVVRDTKPFVKFDSLALSVTMLQAVLLYTPILALDVYMLGGAVQFFRL